MPLAEDSIRAEGETCQKWLTTSRAPNGEPVHDALGPMPLQR